MEQMLADMHKEQDEDEIKRKENERILQEEQEREEKEKQKKQAVFDDFQFWSKPDELDLDDLMADYEEGEPAAVPTPPPIQQIDILQDLIIDISDSKDEDDDSSDDWRMFSCVLHYL